MSDYHDLKKYYPTLVSHIAGKKVPGEGRARVERLRALPKKTQEILLSDAIVDFIYGVEQRFHLSDLETEDFSRAVRQYFFREITKGGFAKKIAQLCKISSDEALKLLDTITAISEEKMQPKKDDRDLVKIPLARALEMYPNIADQMITGQLITSKPFLQPLKPTVKNWIIVYEKILDVSKHNAIERGEFVYRAEATRDLSQQERQRLALLFKSRDEDVDLVIDAQKKKIVFDVVPQETQERMHVVESEKEKYQNKQKEGIFGTNAYLSKNMQNHSVDNITPEHAVYKKTPQVAQDAQKNLYHNDDQKKDIGAHITHEKEVLSRQTQKMTQMMNDLQKKSENSRAVEHVTRNEPQKIQPYARGSIQSEIRNNDRDVSDHAKASNQPRRSSEQRTIHTQMQNVQHKTQDTSDNMTFSSNHTFPSEKEKDHTQKNKTLYHISPMGQRHVITPQKKVDKE
jgi:hypothetical protein